VGALTARVSEMSEVVNKVLSLEPKVRAPKFQRDLEDKVYEHFSELKPLSKRVVRTNLKYHDLTIVVGEWLRLKSSTHVRGHVIASGRDLLGVICAHGDALVPLVRKPIREDFAEMVGLAKQLKSYMSESVKERMIIPVPRVECTIPELSESGLKLVKHTVDGLEYDPYAMERIYLISRGILKQGFFVDRREALFIFEDLGDYVLKLFENLYSEIEKVRQHNEPILRKLEEVAAPYRLARELRG